MIVAVEFNGKVYQSDIYSGKLPVLLKDGGTREVRWGNWSKQTPEDLPKKNEVSIYGIRKGVWAQRNPRPVKIPAQRYLVQGPTDKEWIEVPKGQCIQGMVIEYEENTRLATVVFVVMVYPHPNAPPSGRMPRLIPLRRRS